MITCDISHLKARCDQRGYTLDEVRACIVRQDGDMVTIDTGHPSYPRAAKPGFDAPGVEFKMPQDNSAITSGPGTELKKLLAKIGITATPTCSCNARARRMDEEESRRPGWCEEHLDEIVGWLREEAERRGLPFLNAAGRLLVRRAIKAARKRSPS